MHNGFPNFFKDAVNVKAEIERYVKTHRQRQSDILFQLSTTAGHVFGPQSGSAKPKEQSETFDALLSLLARIDLFISNQKIQNDEDSLSRKLQAETEANIRDRGFWFISILFSSEFVRMILKMRPLIKVLHGILHVYEGQIQ